MIVEERLHAAIEDGEVLRITYAGGSQPGAEREIAPISIKNGKVRAQCYTSNAVKLFAIEKITLIGSSAGQPWSHEKAGQPTYENIDAAKQSHEKEWLEQGWMVEADNHCLSLHQLGKRGKVLKSPTVDLSYSAETSEWVYSLETDDFEEQNRRPRTRPWTLRAKGFETKTFKHLDVAVATMAQWAYELAPNRQ